MHQVVIQQVAAQTTAVIRFRAAKSELSKVVPAACGEVWSFARAANLPRPGRHIALYLDDAINLEVGVEMPAAFVGNDRVVCSTTPAGTVATVVHMGPYNRLHEAHDAIRKWCSMNDHALAGPNWEVYGHWSDNPAQVRTDVFYLLK
jgi:effector-binding domain-containing protein